MRGCMDMLMSGRVDDGKNCPFSCIYVGNAGFKREVMEVMDLSPNGGGSLAFKKVVLVHTMQSKHISDLKANGKAMLCEK